MYFHHIFWYLTYNVIYMASTIVLHVMWKFIVKTLIIIIIIL